MFINFFIDKKSKSLITSNAIIASTAISIFIYIFAFCTYFISDYPYGQDYNLEKVVRDANFIHVSLVLAFNFIILLLFIYISNKILPKKIYIYRSTRSFYKWILVSSPLFFLNLYYLNNVVDRITAKESSTVFVVGILYFLLAYQGWVILSSRNKLILIGSIFLVCFTALVQFEREPFLFAFFGILLRLFSSNDIKKVPIFFLCLIIAFTSITYISKRISRVLYEQSGLLEFSNYDDWTERYGNPILKASGELATKISLEVVYLSDKYKPKYLKRRILIPVQLERLFLPKNASTVSNGTIATARYINKNNTISGLGFSIFLDFYISIGIFAIIILPLFFSFILKYTATSPLNFFLIVTNQAWFFKLLRSDLWPSIIPYIFILIIIIISIIFSKKKKQPILETN